MAFCDGFDLSENIDTSSVEVRESSPSPDKPENQVATRAGVTLKKHSKNFTHYVQE